jgi:hypothetical protein
LRYKVPGSLWCSCPTQNLPASTSWVAGITGVPHHAWLQLFIFEVHFIFYWCKLIPAINMGVQVSPLYADLHSFRHMPHVVYSSTFRFWGITIVISIVALLTNNVQEIFFPCTSPAFVVYLMTAIITGLRWNLLF